jgi:hypothetical protein
VSWALAAALAAGIGLGTVVLSRQGVGENSPVSTLSSAQIEAQLAAAGVSAPVSATPAATVADPSVVPTPQVTVTATPHSTTRPTPAASHSGGGPSVRPTAAATSSPSAPVPSAAPVVVDGVVSSTGGSVVARCSYGSAGPVVYLLSWSPAQGYSTDEVRRGPDHEAEVTFTGAGEVQIHVTCGTSGPVGQVEYDSATDH